MSDKNQVTYIGTTDFRNQQIKFGIKAIDRSRHMYIIGKTGMGKSTVLENLAVQDIANGDGMVFIDPHGSAIEKLLDYVPQHRINDVIYFAPFDTEFPISFNVMEDTGPERRHLVVSGVMASFKKIWQDAWSARMEYILTNTLLALMETPNSTLLGVNRMYADKAYRDMIIANVTDNSVKTFWLDEFNKWDVKFMREATAAIQNKIGQFTGNPLIRNIIGQPKSSFDFRRAMDERKIILINLSKGLIGEENMRLLGGMIITKLYLAAMSRADVGTYALDTLPPCYFFVDEFQNFANESFADILAEARKYKLNLTVANQYIAQMEEQVRDAIFGNVGSMISFRVGPFDAEVLERAFMPVFTKEDLVNIAQFQMYLTLSIDAVGSKPFSARGLSPIPKPDISYKDAVIHASRALYAQPRAVVEEAVMEWFTPIGGGQSSASSGEKGVNREGGFANRDASGSGERQVGASARFNPNFDSAKISAEIRARERGIEEPAESSKKQPTPAPSQTAPRAKAPTPKPSEPVMSKALQSLIDQIDAPASEVSTSATIERESPKTEQNTRVFVKESPVNQKPEAPNVEAPVSKPTFSRAANESNKQALRDLLKKITPASAPVSTPASTPVATPDSARVAASVSNPTPAPSQTVPVQTPTSTPTPPQEQTQTPFSAETTSLPETEPAQQTSSAPSHFSMPPSSSYNFGKPKEVPEDILRKILE